MGAEHVCILLDQPFDGVDVFHSTNGFAHFSANSPHLLVYDASVILLLDYDSGITRHTVPPRGCYFTNQAVLSGSIHADLYGARSSGPFEPVEITSADARMHRGLGPASGGLMPSVHRPYLDVLRAK